MDYVIPIVVMTACGFLSSVLLIIASVFLSNNYDEKFDKVRQCLPGINCSVCGYANCDEYARGILNGDVTTKCKPGGKKTVEKLADVLGQTN